MRRDVKVGRAYGPLWLWFPVILVLLALAPYVRAAKTVRVLSGNQVLPRTFPVSMDPDPEPQKNVPLEILQQAVPLVEGLRSPDGIAYDAETGDIYVSEEDPATIVRIHPDGSHEVLIDASTPVYERRGISKKHVKGLRSPEGVALDGKGNLLVVEDIPGGRLISYHIQKARKRAYYSGTVVPLPIEDSHFAWESVAVGPSGELLIAGSTVESFLSELEKEGLFRGVVLYRDTQGEWWMPLDYPMTSYSAAAFSPDGKVAFFACEVSGDVGCLDLQSHTLRIYHADQTFKSPEGLCVLPDGSALVAEEGGKIYRLDPITDTIQYLYDNQRTIESLLWDEANRRLLVTDDQQGSLLVLESSSDPLFDAPSEIPPRILFEAQSTPVEMIPDHCPDYLARVLKVGGFDPDQKDGEVSFQDFLLRLMRTPCCFQARSPSRIRSAGFSL